MATSVYCYEGYNSIEPDAGLLNLSSRFRQLGALTGHITSPKGLRVEDRQEFRDAIWLTSLHNPGVLERAVTENVSVSGARLVTKRFWEPAEAVLVSLPPGFCAHARIVYCYQLPSEEFALGIQLIDTSKDWVKNLQKLK
ncbi:MAG TPA: PilZ domain-containing protein [Candidatus Acidoferrum sp.]|jgi:hypothetical protein